MNTTQNISPTIIRYRNKIGFRDGTEFIEFDGAKCCVVDHDGSRMEINTITKEDCEEYVARGSWIKEVVQRAPEEVDYNSKEHKLSVLAAALDGKECQYLDHPAGLWIDEDGFQGVSESICNNLPVRIKPDEPVFDTVPLDDYGIGEAVKSAIGEIGVIARVSDNYVCIEFASKEEWPTTPDLMMSAGFKIYRDGWQPCSKTVERKG